MRRWIARYSDQLLLLLLLLAGFLFFGSYLRPAAGTMLTGPDLAWFFHPTFSFTFDMVRQGTLPLWNPHLFLGFPQFAEPQLATFYPLVWLGAWLPAGQTYAIFYALHFGLAGMGGYVLVRQLNGRRAGAFIAGLVLAFNGFMIGHFFAGHLSHIMTIAYTPWVLAAAQWSFTRIARNTQLATAVVAGLPLGLAFLAGYAPFFPILVIAVTFLMGWRAIEAWQRSGWRDAFRIVGQWVILGFIGGMVAAVQLLPAFQFAALSSRVATADYDFAASLSLPFQNLLTLLMPQLFGLPFSDVEYWAGTPLYAYWEHAMYVGILPLFLFGLGMIAGRNAWRGWGWFGLVALLVALGPPGVLHRLMYQFVPGFGLFRVPARLAYLFVLSTAVLSGLMFERWFAMSPVSKRSWRQYLKKGLVVGSSGLLLLTLLAILLQSIAPDAETVAQAGNVAAQLVRFMLLAGGAFLLLILGHERSGTAVGVLAVCLVVVDLWGNGFVHLQSQSAEPALGWIMADLALPEDREAYRLGSSGLPANQAYFYGFRHVRGYDDFRLETAVTLAGMAGEDARIGGMLGVRYLLIGPDSERQPDASQGWSLLTAPAGATIYERGEVQPRFFVVHEVIPAENAAASLRLLRDESLDLTETAVVQARADTSCAIQPAGDASPVLSVVEHAPTQIVLQAETKKTGWLVLADLNYPGWEATINGQIVPIQTTNYALRGLCLPPGEHEVVFRFRPAVLQYGLFATGAGLLVILLSFSWLLWQRHIRKFNE